MLDALMSTDANTSPPSLHSDNNNTPSSYFRVQKRNLQKLASYATIAAPQTTEDRMLSCREDSRSVSSDKEVDNSAVNQNKEAVKMSTVQNFDNTRDHQTTNATSSEPPLTPPAVDDHRQSRPRLPSGSSLKSRSKTPPARRKSVRFADVLGLDLETIRVLTSDIPAIDFGHPETSVPRYPGRYLSLLFAQPSSLHGFLPRVHRQKVVLENILVTGMSILGTVKVSNVAYHKSVRVRFTVDGWLSFSDIPATYVQGSCDGPCDRFSFGISVPRECDRAEFAICYEAGGQKFWDNNDGQNYAFDCLSRGVVHTDG